MKRGEEETWRSSTSKVVEGSTVFRKVSRTSKQTQALLLRLTGTNLFLGTEAVARRRVTGATERWSPERRANIVQFVVVDEIMRKEDELGFCCSKSMVVMTMNMPNNEKQGHFRDGRRNECEQPTRPSDLSR